MARNHKEIKRFDRICMDLYGFGGPNFAHHIPSHQDPHLIFCQAICHLCFKSEDLEKRARIENKHFPNLRPPHKKKMPLLHIESCWLFFLCFMKKSPHPQVFLFESPNKYQSPSILGPPHLPSIDHQFFQINFGSLKRKRPVGR